MPKKALIIERVFFQHLIARKKQGEKRAKCQQKQWPVTAIITAVVMAMEWFVTLPKN